MEEPRVDDGACASERTDRDIQQKRDEEWAMCVVDIQERGIQVLTNPAITPKEHETHPWQKSKSVSHHESPDEYVLEILSPEFWLLLTSFVNDNMSDAITKNSIATSRHNNFRKAEPFVVKRVVGMMMYLANNRSPARRTFPRILAQLRKELNVLPLGVNRFFAIMQSMSFTNVQLQLLFSELRRTFVRCWEGAGELSE